MSEWVDQFNHWLVPSSHSTGNIPRLDASTDSTERLWCWTGSNLLKMQTRARFLVVIPLEVWLDWTLIPGTTDSTERLQCKTGSKVAKFNSIQPLRLDPKRSNSTSIDGFQRSQQIKEAPSLLHSATWVLDRLKRPENQLRPLDTASTITSSTSFQCK